MLGFRILKWLVLVFVYISLFPTCIIPIFIIAAIAFSIYAFNQDVAREQMPSDDFTDDNLLYRYGYEIRNETIPILGAPDWDKNQSASLVKEMRTCLAEKMNNRFSRGVSVDGAFPIKDRQRPDDQRLFLRVLFNSNRGSQVGHFVNFDESGKYIIIHFITRVRGTRQWHDTVDFVITSPLTIWLWGLKWINNNYSIVAALSRTIDNSYDYFDLRAFFVSSSALLFDEIRAFLKERDLLTEELATIIQNNITNSTSINISNSSNVSLGSIATTLRGAIPGASRA